MVVSMYRKVNIFNLIYCNYKNILEILEFVLKYLIWMGMYKI